MAKALYDEESRGTVSLTKISESQLSVHFHPEEHAYRSFVDGAIEQIPSRRILHFDSGSDTLTMWPIRTHPGPRVLESKYEKLSEIALEGFGFETPNDEDQLIGSLESLPIGMVKTPTYGLGFKRELISVVSALEAQGVRRLMISRTQSTRFEDDMFVVNANLFDGVRLENNRTISTYQNRSRKMREVLAHNSLFFAKWPERFNEHAAPYGRDAVTKVLVSAAISSKKLSNSDEDALLDATQRNISSIAKRDPVRILQLQKTVEIVALEELIDGFQRLISKKKTKESDWQELICRNPFILTMVFGYPMVKIGEQVYVGGQSFDGSGGKVSDFMVQNPTTANVGLVEIKTPDTKLTGAEYRGGVRKITSELASTIVQVLDQRYMLTKEINSKLANSSQLLKTYFVECVIIAGRTGENPDQVKSFDLFRNSLKDVSVFTFDEVLCKLRVLSSFLNQSDSDSEVVEPPF